MAVDSLKKIEIVDADSGQVYLADSDISRTEAIALVTSWGGIVVDVDPADSTQVSTTADSNEDGVDIVWSRDCNC